MLYIKSKIITTEGSRFSLIFKVGIIFVNHKSHLILNLMFEVKINEIIILLMAYFSEIIIRVPDC